MSIRKIVDSIAQACSWHVVEEDGMLSIDVPTGDGRSQVVLITNDTDMAEQKIVRYWSVIGGTEDVDFRRCLEENSRLAYGAIAIQDNQLVIMDTQLVQDADPMEVAASIGNLAAYADRYEKDLFGTDLY
ncbi:MAG: hypothetical protein KDD82_18910 [Planctomycetes bacterium]|nr:hypothetical protein [Planctomycetota bacterium]